LLTTCVTNQATFEYTSFIRHTETTETTEATIISRIHSSTHAFIRLSSFTINIYSLGCNLTFNRRVISIMDDEDVLGVDLEGSALLENVESGESQPLRTLSRDDRLNNLMDFVQEYGLSEKLELFKKASMILQSDLVLEQIPNITEPEIHAFQQETDNKWKQPKMLYFTILICSIGAIEQGWAQTGMNGANLFFPKAFGIGSNSSKDRFIVGFINSAIYLSTGLM
jgi:hypothetical protein